MNKIMQKIKELQERSSEKVAPQLQRFSPDFGRNESVKRKKGRVSKTPASKKGHSSEAVDEIAGPIPGYQMVGTPGQFRDQGKRQRIALIAFAVVALLFLAKLWRPGAWEVFDIFLVAFSLSLVTYLGLLWAFRFQVSIRGYLTVLTLPSVFVFGSVLFLELFFFEEFQRIYESILFGTLLLGFFIGLLLVFRTANILNVSTFRSIPLLQVAQTSSYVISLFSIFFISFFNVSLGLPIPLTLGLLLLLYGVVVFGHLSHFGIEAENVVLYAVALSWVATISAGVLMLWPVGGLFVVLLPTLVIYIGIGIVMHDVKRITRALIYWEYMVIAIIVLAIIILRARWGIGGPAWVL